MKAFFNTPVRLTTTCDQVTREQLEEIARRRGQFPGRVLGDLLDAEAERLGLKIADPAGATLRSPAGSATTAAAS